MFFGILIANITKKLQNMQNIGNFGIWNIQKKKKKNSQNIENSGIWNIPLDIPEILKKIYIRRGRKVLPG